MKRVFGVIGCTAAVTLYLCMQLPLTAALLLGAACLLAFGVLLCLPRTSWRLTAVTVLMTAAVAVTSFSLQTWLRLQPVMQHAGDTAVVTATVYGKDTTPDSISYELRVVDGDLPVGTKLKYWQSDTEWQVGDTLTGKLELVDIEQQTDSRLLMLSSRAKGIYLYAWPAYTGSVEDAAPQGLPPMTAWLFSLRADLSARATELLGGEEGALTAAVCFGDVSGIPQDTENHFRRAGIAHLLVVSGMHMSLLALAISKLLRRRLSARLTAIITILCLLFFMLLIGFSPSVVRAGVMMMLVMSSGLFRRRGDGLNSMGLAFTLLSLADPFCIYDIGLQLSFGATLGILLLAKPLAAWLRSLFKLTRDSRGYPLFNGLISGLAVTLAATVTVVPLSALYFGTVSLVSPLTNLLSMWLSNGVLVLGWVTVLLSYIPLVGGYIGFALAWVQRLLCTALLALAEFFGGFIRAVVSFHQPYQLLWLVGAPLLCLLGYRLLKGKGLRIAAASAAACLLVTALLQTAVWHGVTTVRTLSAGTSVVTLITHHNRHTLLLDGSEKSWKQARYLLSDHAVVTVDSVFAYAEWQQEGYDRLLAEVSVRNAYWLQDTETVQFGEDLTVSVRNGFVRLTVEETKLLLCPSSGDVSDLPSAWYANDAICFVRRAPYSVGRLTADEALWFGSATDRQRYAVTLPWGCYPITIPDGNAAVFHTRGAGDITVND